MVICPPACCLPSALVTGSVWLTEPAGWLSMLKSGSVGTHSSKNCFNYRKQLIAMGLWGPCSSDDQRQVNTQAVPSCQELLKSRNKELCLVKNSEAGSARSPCGWACWGLQAHLTTGLRWRWWWWQHILPIMKALLTEHRVFAECLA